MRLLNDQGQLNWSAIGRRARSFFAVTLSLVILIGGGWFAYEKANDIYQSWRTADDYAGAGKDDILVSIPSGVSLTEIGGILIDAEVIKSMKAYKAAVQDEPKAKNIQAGKYTLKTHLPAKTAIQMILDPRNRKIDRVTIIEGLRVERQWNVISKTTKISIDEIKKTAANAKNYGLPAWSKGKIEGFMFPDTYDLSDPPNVEQIIKSQLRQFNKVAKDVKLEQRAAKLGLTPLQVLTVASLIQAEVNISKYQPMVAAVIYNRLKKDMLLQFDSTVHYAVNRYDTVGTSSKERALDSPYNTYKTKGLPPGPINSPGKAAIEAALSPADTNALYFVTVNPASGETVFTNTLKDHEREQAKFQAWCKANPGKC